MRVVCLTIVMLLIATACAVESTNQQPDWIEEVNAITVVDAPSPQPGTYAPENRGLVERGENLVELLACGACHTDGALVGEPDMNHALAGSRIGIAYTSPLDERWPGVIYPPNITPEKSTGIGNWSDPQIADAIRAGAGRHASRRITAMPWQGYAKMSDEDVAAIVSYLRSIRPVKHEVPEQVEPGQAASSPFVYFGVYRRTD